jgi:hypothetical protein
VGELDYLIIISYIFFKNLTKALNHIFSISLMSWSSKTKSAYVMAVIVGAAALAVGRHWL